MSTIYSPQIVTNGLVLALDAGNTKSYQSGSTTWFDKSGLRNNGTLVNGPTFSSGSLGSIVFDGVNDICDFTAAPLIPASSAQTHNVFCKITSTGFSGDIVSINDSSNSTSVRLYYNTDNKFYASVVRQNIIDYSIGSSAITDTNNFFMVTGVFTGSTINFYLNGVFINSISYSVGGTGLLNSKTSVGSSYNLSSPGTAQRFYRGSVAIVQLYNRALSAQEVAQNYNALKSRFGL